MFKSNNVFRSWIAGATLLVALVCTSAHAQRQLQSVDFVALEGERVLLTLTLSEPAPEPVVFTIEKPARISLDLFNTSLAITDRFRKIGVGKTRSVAAIEAKGRTRVVLELSEMAPYTVRVDGNKVLVQVDGGKSSIATATAAIETLTPTVTTTAQLTAREKRPPAISNVDFRRGEKGEGRVVITLADPKTGVDVTEIGGKVIARFKNVSVAEKLIRRLDVLDFATPVKFIDVRRNGSDAEITLTPIEAIDFEQLAYQTGNVFTLEFQPISPEEVEKRKKENPQFTGERVSLSFQSVDIRSLLQIIADVAGTNMVVSDSVSGEIAMRLQNVPWDQALDIILRTKGLGMRQQGTIMLVAPLEELALREKVELESQKQNAELAPLRSEIIQVNYAKAGDMVKLLKSGNSSMLSARAAVTVDERTNTLIILETREKLGEIRQLISQLDIPVRQVLIESRIVIANDDYSKQLGARFGVSGVNGSSTLLSTAGNSLSANQPVNNALSGQALAPDTSLIETETGGLSTRRFNVNLPAAGGGAPGIALAILGANYLIDLELSALQTEGRAELISNPRVITANGKQANVEQGTEIGYREASSSGAATVAFKKAVLSLTVTPQITPDSRILMDLAVTNDTPGVPFDNVPSINTRRLNTQVLVKSGETVVLGGVFEEAKTTSKSKVPLFGDIPLLGNLFKNDSKSDNRRELLIFVTPKMLQEGLAIN